MEWEASNPQPEIAAFIIGFLGQEIIDAVEHGQQPDPIIGFGACRRTQLVRMAEAYGVPVGKDGLFKGGTPKGDIVKIMDVMFNQGKFTGSPKSTGESAEADDSDYSDMTYRELQVLAADRGLKVFGVKRDALIVALNG